MMRDEADDAILEPDGGGECRGLAMRLRTLEMKNVPEVSRIYV